MTAFPAGGATSSRPDDRHRRWQVTPLTLFLAILALVLAAYTLLAFDLEWRTAAGRIGPGFFPRIVGGIGVALCLVAAVRSMRTPEDRSAEAGNEHGRHPTVFLGLVAASAGFFLTLRPLGAIVASALFLFVTLWLLDRGQMRLRIAVSVLVPLGMYLLFQILLNAGLPRGILPML